MKRIPLTQGKEARVSDCDYGYLRRWSWYYGQQNGYAMRVSANRKCILMHRVVAARKGIIGRTREIDHRNLNKLDNQRHNLRPATTSQNRAYCKRRKNNTSGFKGVCEEKRWNRWRAYIKIDGKQRHLGTFPKTHAGKIAAARAYNKAARSLFKQFAYLNSV